MNNTHRPRLRALCLALLFAAMLPLYSQPNNSQFRRSLAKDGLDAAGVTFQFVQKHTAGRMLYRSSVPIDCNGQPVSLWLVEGYSLSFPRTHYHLTPYTPLLTQVETLCLLLHSSE